ncbi:MAG: ATP-binding protein [Gammaproteobacteria bacterium]|nr:ATP-binding protein [Gammaproteobacteria bacterium]
MSQKRSDPEALLQQIQEEESQAKAGKLKIYLGAAPGVGKTYKMLHDAHLSRVKNLDVVVGIVESHGRHAIDKTLAKFEILPPQVLTYREKRYVEFDLDAALKRDPGLILVDEMAHTNIEGLRHEKRWQDIKELLDRGIDVCTTLNVQHIESLKDDVAQIIQAPVQETVPDSMLERAHTIELVDLSVEELLKRLKDGKIYIPEQANIAAEHFFREGNLIALRELALRVMANFVETDVISYRKTEGIHKIWPTSDKILVCVGSSQQSLKLIRIAKQLSQGLQAEWAAVYVDMPKVSVSKAKRNRAIENLRLAEQLGAETHVLMGHDVVKEILQFARDANVTQIMLCKDRSHSWRRLFRRSLADALIADSGEINLYIVGGKKKAASLAFEAPATKISWRDYGFGFLAIAFATSVNLGFASSLTYISMIMIYIVALISGYLSVLKRRESKISYNIQRQARALYDFSQKLLQTRGIDEILALGVQYIAQSLQADVMALLPKKGILEARVSQPEGEVLGEKEQSVAHWVYEMAQPAGLGTDTLASSSAYYVPLSVSEKKVLGVLRIKPRDNMLFSPEQMHLLESFISQLTQALKIENLQEKFRKRQLKIEVDTAKNALLKTISTQLNNPLKFILGVIGSSISPNTSDVGLNISEELNKISLINNNILQVIEFETHHTHLDKKITDLMKLIQAALRQFRKTNHQRTIEIHAPDSLPKLAMDGARIQEVLLNLLDNAVKYSPEDSIVNLNIETQLSHVLVSVENEGNSIKEKDLSKIFNPFYRSVSSTHHDSLGLGLTLCQFNVKAHGGEIWAENLAKEGTIAFRFTLPY